MNMLVLKQASVGLMHYKNLYQIMSFMQHVFSQICLGDSLVLSVKILY